MNKAKWFVVLLFVVAAGLTGFVVTKNNLLKLNNQASGSTPTVFPTAAPTPTFEKTLGDFLITDREIELKDGRPQVYFFGGSSCPHCVWEKPVVQKVFNKFGNEIDYHENFDSSADMDVFRKYSDINPGYVPFLILGGKYSRVGAGENLGETEEESKKLEEEALSAILCKLTNGKPVSVCDSLKDKTEQIK